MSAVVDTLHYADTPEIEAFLRHFHLSMLRLRPPSEWTRGHQDIGSFQGLDENVMMETISGEEHLRSLLNEKHFDLQLVHYQYTGFEHFDIVHSVNGSYDIASQKKAGLAKLMSVLELCLLKLVCLLIKVGGDVFEPGFFLTTKKHFAKPFVCKAVFLLRTFV